MSLVYVRKKLTADTNHAQEIPFSLTVKVFGRDKTDQDGPNCNSPDYFWVVVGGRRGWHSKIRRDPDYHN